MQNPVGYQMNEDGGRAEMTDFVAVLLTNPVALAAFPHTLFAALHDDGRRHHHRVAAWHLARKQNLDDDAPGAAATGCGA